MKTFKKIASIALVLAAPLAPAQTTTTTTTTTAGNYYNFIRQQQQQTNVVWDMPVTENGTSAAALLTQEGGALFQLWTIASNTAKDYLLDQKLVGAYLPKGTITIDTLDSYNGVPRIRVDQPFRVTFKISNLESSANAPAAAKRVLAEHHLAPNPDGSLNITAAQAISGTPFSSGYIEKNGNTHVNYAASSIQAANPLKSRGEEHFVLHILGDGLFSQTQLATAFVQVWPMASGAISGVEDGSTVRGKPPTITVKLDDLYPRSDTYLRIHNVETESDSDGTVIPGSRLVLDQELPQSRILEVDDYADLFEADGPYRIDLLHTTPYGTERLDSTTFTISRSMRVNAMQVDSETYMP
ncbi:MAG: hypothetical protein ABJQ29_14035 [Luteolibacter sp.]